MSIHRKFKWKFIGFQHSSFSPFFFSFSLLLQTFQFRPKTSGIISFRLIDDDFISEQHQQQQKKNEKFHLFSRKFSPFFLFFSFLYSSNTLKHEIRNSSFQSRVFKKMPSKRFLTNHPSPLLCSSRRRQYLLRLFYIFSYLAEKSETKRNACMFHSNAQLKSSFGWLLDCCLSCWSRVN